MLKPLKSEWDRICAEFEASKWGRGFKFVKITFDDNTTCRCTRQYWTPDLEKRCEKENWKIEYIY
jgi:hypothetical protein